MHADGVSKDFSPEKKEELLRSLRVECAACGLSFIFVAECLDATLEGVYFRTTGLLM